MANEHSRSGAKVGNMGNLERMLVISTALVGSKWESTAGDPIMVGKILLAISHTKGSRLLSENYCFSLLFPYRTCH